MKSALHWDFWSVSLHHALLFHNSLCKGAREAFSLPEVFLSPGLQTRSEFSAMLGANRQVPWCREVWVWVSKNLYKLLDLGSSEGQDSASVTSWCSKRNWLGDISVYMCECARGKWEKNETFYFDLYMVWWPIYLCSLTSCRMIFGYYSLDCDVIVLSTSCWMVFSSFSQLVTPCFNKRYKQQGGQSAFMLLCPTKQWIKEGSIHWPWMCICFMTCLVCFFPPFPQAVALRSNGMRNSCHQSTLGAYCSI